MFNIKANSNWGDYKVPDSYILSNDLGSFYFWTEEPYSKFCGLFFNINGEVVKCLEKLRTCESLKDTNQTEAEIINERESLLESLYLDKDSNSFAYRLSQPADIIVELDVRHASDMDEWGRHYYIDKASRCLVIHYFKENSGSKKYEYYVAIKCGNLNHDTVERFEKRNYSYDSYRSSDSHRHIYQAVNLFSSFITVSMSNDKKEAISNAKRLFYYYDVHRDNDPRCNRKNETITSEKRLNDCYKLANSYMDKHITHPGIVAGYPWFYQVWTRDELISMIFLILKSDIKKIKHIFNSYFNHKSYCGRMPAIFPDQGNRSADAMGWLAFRFSQFLDELELPENKKKHYSKKELSVIVDYFIKSFYLLQRYHMKEDLVWSGSDESWMDTSYGDEGREGYCIEIQALNLAMLKLISRLSGDGSYKDIQTKMHEKVVTSFLEKDMLYDSLDNDFIPRKDLRPNIFIAYYVYPELLTPNLWKKVFDKTLDALWLDWGGLATFDKRNPSFVSTHTGENNKSYHRGDSWFYINCMAATCMHRLDHARYEKKIKKIIDACCEECINNGVIGSIAEISSAESLTGYGCLSQAWSLAMFIELVNEIEFR